MADIPHFLDENDRLRLAAGVKAVNKLEKKWFLKLETYFAAMTRQMIATLGPSGFEIPHNFDLFHIFADHYFESLELGFKDADRHPPKTLVVKRLAGAGPPPKIPKSLGALMELWDQYRKGKLLKRQMTFAERIKAAYLERLKKIQLEHGEEFREGTTYDQWDVVEKITRASYATQSRAKMIVETETTRFFNEGRRQVYDQSQDVTHYLFLAIRDHRTTKWCKTRQGLVYAKGDPLLDIETPPCHWNCRSEVVPLTPLNPKHLILIKNPSIQRRNNSPAPLPKGWNK